jgi:hypothetical protein
MRKIVSQETKCSILKYYENMKQDRPDLNYVWWSDNRVNRFFECN